MMLKTNGPPIASQVAKLTTNVKLHKGMTTFVRVRVIRHHGCFFAEPVSAAGASLLSTLAYSDGIVIAKDIDSRLDRDHHILHKGKDVEVILLKDIHNREGMSIVHTKRK
jgi:molybdopterin biosynthesis enzyme